MLNMNFTDRVVINTSTQAWIATHAVGVERKLLERENLESGHATSIVRYAPRARFDPHVHSRGEEIFVISGVFSDERGDYGPGTYLRNPPGSFHAPFSEKGCVLFVKLGQFAMGDRETICIDTKAQAWLPGHGELSVMPLHGIEGQNTALVRWPAGEQFIPHRHFGGEEILVLSGTFMDEFGQYPPLTWIRSPHMSMHHPFVKEETLILVKTGHLLFS